MDDSRLANLLFLAGLASLAMPGCGGDGEPGVGPGGGPPGNPLASDDALAEGGGDDVCSAFVEKLIECGGYDDDDYSDDDYYGVSVFPGYSDYCDQYLQQLESYAGSACVAATVEYFSCLSGLSCEAFGGDEAGCGPASAALETACSAGGGGGDGGVGEDEGE